LAKVDATLTAIAGTAAQVTSPWDEAAYEVFLTDYINEGGELAGQLSLHLQVAKLSPALFVDSSWRATAINILEGYRTNNRRLSALPLEMVPDKYKTFHKKLIPVLNLYNNIYASMQKAIAEMNSSALDAALKDAAQLEPLLKQAIDLLPDMSVVPPSASATPVPTRAAVAPSPCQPNETPDHCSTRQLYERINQLGQQAPKLSAEQEEARHREFVASCVELYLLEGKSSCPALIPYP
jgi:hypothetical protein